MRSSSSASTARKFSFVPVLRNVLRTESADEGARGLASQGSRRHGADASPSGTGSETPASSTGGGGLGRYFQSRVSHSGSSSLRQSPVPDALRSRSPSPYPGVARPGDARQRLSLGLPALGSGSPTKSPLVKAPLDRHIYRTSTVDAVAVGLAGDADASATTMEGEPAASASADNKVRWLLGSPGRSAGGQVLMRREASGASATSDSGPTRRTRQPLDAHLQDVLPAKLVAKQEARRRVRCRSRRGRACVARSGGNGRGDAIARAGAPAPVRPRAAARMAS